MQPGRPLNRPSWRCLRTAFTCNAQSAQHVSRRPFHVSSSLAVEETTTTTTPVKWHLDPALVSTRSGEKKFLRQGILPIGSRRRRVALRNSPNIPFEHMPYQCFQEALEILRQDRQEKLKLIEVERGRIARLRAKETSSVEEERRKLNRVTSMKNQLEKLKILADINDPMIKKRFEDGQGDMNRPIYRYLADKKWRSYRRKVLIQRLTQMSVVPDLVSHLDPTAEVQLAFKRRNVQAGDIVESRVSEVPARLHVQVFDQGERRVSVVVIDPDVPDLETDGFRSRCHYLAVNIPISPTQTSVPLSRLPAEAQQLLSWLPPHAQKGSPYHRLAVFVLQQPDGQTIDASSMDALYRDDFNIRSFIARQKLNPIGAYLFRTQWDEGTAGVMARAGIAGAEVELKRRRVEPLVKKQLPLKKKRNLRGLAGLPTKRLSFSHKKMRLSD